MVSICAPWITYWPHPLICAMDFRILEGLRHFHLDFHQVAIMGCVNKSACCWCLNARLVFTRAPAVDAWWHSFLRQINRLPNATRTFACLFVSSHLLSSQVSRCSAPIPYQLNNFIMGPSQSMCLPSVQHGQPPYRSKGLSGIPQSQLRSCFIDIKWERILRPKSCRRVRAKATAKVERFGSHCSSGFKRIPTNQDQLRFSKVEGKTASSRTKTTHLFHHSIRCSHVCSL